MARLFLLFSHRLTDEQIQDAQASLDVSPEDMIHMPEALQQDFSNVPPELESVEPWVEPLRNWLGQVAQVGDYVLIQGDFGLVVSLVSYCRARHLRPLYSTTERQVVMEDNGKKTSIFKHIRYRFY